jgi:hypothetical protein
MKLLLSSRGGEFDAFLIWDAREQSHLFLIGQEYMSAAYRFIMSLT